MTAFHLDVLPKQSWTWFVIPICLCPMIVCQTWVQELFIKMVNVLGFFGFFFFQNPSTIRRPSLMLFCYGFQYCKLYDEVHWPSKTVGCYWISCKLKSITTVPSFILPKNLLYHVCDFLILSSSYVLVARSCCIVWSPSIFRLFVALLWLWNSCVATLLIFLCGPLNCLFFSLIFAYPVFQQYIYIVLLFMLKLFLFLISIRDANRLLLSC